MAVYKISLAAIQQAVQAAGPQAEAVATILYQDIGRPLPSKELPPADAPFGSYHTVPKGIKNAGVEGADVPDSTPDNGDSENDTPSQSSN